jgi:hypothetical protein
LPTFSFAIAATAVAALTLLGGAVAPLQWPHERSVVSDHTTALVPDAIGFDEAWLPAEQRSVLLISREARKAKQRERFVTGSLAGQVIAVVLTAMLLDEFDPTPGERFELCDLRWIDHVIYDTSNHLVPLPASASIGVIAPAIRLATA